MLTQHQALLLNAHHEAAHAAVATYHGLPVISLDLQVHTDKNGAWSIGGITYVTYFPRLADQFALQGAAGELAALKWLNEQGLHSAETAAVANADHDRDEVIELLAQDDIHICWSEIRVLAQAQVDYLWAHISAVAHAAAESGRLTGPEIDGLLFAAPRSTTDSPRVTSAGQATLAEGGWAEGER